MRFWCRMRDGKKNGQKGRDPRQSLSFPKTTGLVSIVLLVQTKCLVLRMSPHPHHEKYTHTHT